jgi:hypothetical protein
VNPGRCWAIARAKGQRASGCIRSPLAQLRSRGKVIHAAGIDCPDDRPGNHCVGSTSNASFGAAVAAAKQADQIVVFVGTDHSIETEGRDRQSLGLPGAQPALLEAVRQANPGKPITVVLLNGGAVAMDSFAPPAKDAVADALIEAFFPGIEGGEALACALYGEEGCNRWGRLPVTVFPESFAKNDMANMGISSGGSGLRTYKSARSINTARPAPAPCNQTVSLAGGPKMQVGRATSVVSVGAAAAGITTARLELPCSALDLV